jgi:outer membrane protein TolC
MQGFYDIGEATAYNVNQAKVAVSNVTDAYYETLKELKGHQDDLVRVLGSDPGQNIDVSVTNQIDVMEIADVAHKVREGEKVFQSGSGYSPILKDQFTTLEERSMDHLFSTEELEKWVTAADETRPDILLAKTVVSIAKQQVEEKQGEYWPTLSILAGYGGGSTPYLDRPSDRFTNQLFQWAAGLSLNWTIFDGTGRESRIRKAKAEERATKFDAIKVMQNAHTDVREQIYKMEKALSKYLTASANLKLAEETLKQANSQLEIGYATIFDYLVSVDGFVRARTTLDEGRFELLTSYYGLLHACGRSE